MQRIKSIAKILLKLSKRKYKKGLYDNKYSNGLDLLVKLALNLENRNKTIAVLAYIGAATDYTWSPVEEDGEEGSLVGCKAVNACAVPEGDLQNHFTGFDLAVELLEHMIDFDEGAVDLEQIIKNVSEYLDDLDAFKNLYEIIEEAMDNTSPASELESIKKPVTQKIDEATHFEPDSDLRWLDNKPDEEMKEAEKIEDEELKFE